MLLARTGPDGRGRGGKAAFAPEARHLSPEPPGSLLRQAEVAFLLLGFGGAGDVCEQFLQPLGIGVEVPVDPFTLAAPLPDQ